MATCANAPRPGPPPAGLVQLSYGPRRRGAVRAAVSCPKAAPGAGRGGAPNLRQPARTASPVSGWRLSARRVIRTRAKSRSVSRRSPSAASRPPTSGRSTTRSTWTWLSSGPACGALVFAPNVMSALGACPRAGRSERGSGRARGSGDAVDQSDGAGQPDDAGPAARVRQHGSARTSTRCWRAQVRTVQAVGRREAHGHDPPGRSAYARTRSGRRGTLRLASRSVQLPADRSRGLITVGASGQRTARSGSSQRTATSSDGSCGASMR